LSHGLGARVPLPTGRRLVIPDIHGCASTLKKLLQQLDLKLDDQLFFLGDYINKGPDSLGVLACIQNLIDQRYNVFPLLGNHDQMMLQYLETREEAIGEKLIEMNGPEFISDQIYEFEKYRHFLSQLVVLYESGDFLLVHAGFDFSLPDPFSDLSTMLTIRGFEYDKKKTDGKRIVHGHYPHPLGHIQSAIRDRSDIIPLDNGCVYEDRTGQGHLLCLNLDSFKLWVQPNVENQ
jgi:serine/threonine protein phosphatase 1